MTSAVTGLPPGLSRTRRSRRPAPAPPASSQRSEPAARQGAVARPRTSSPSASHSWVPATAGASEPVAVRVTAPLPGRGAAAVAGRSVGSTASSRPLRSVRRASPSPSTSCGSSPVGPVTTRTVPSVSAPGTPRMPVSSSPGHIASTAVVRLVSLTGACSPPLAAARSRPSGMGGAEPDETRCRPRSEDDPGGAGDEPAHGAPSAHVRPTRDSRRPNGTARKARNTIPASWDACHHGCGSTTVTVSSPAPSGSS